MLSLIIYLLLSYIYFFHLPITGSNMNNACMQRDASDLALNA